MQHPDPGRTGARDSSDTDALLDGNVSVSSKSRAPVQAIPESEAEALAFGYGLPPAAHLTACRATWWRLRRLGVPLPAELRVIRIAGGGHG